MDSDIGILPKNIPPLPHQTDRKKGQPYAKEYEDYSGGVAQPPKEQVGKQEPKTPRAK